MARSLGWASFALVLLACTSCGDDGAGGGPCSGLAPNERCGQKCASDAACGAGFHCTSAGTCFAACSTEGGCGAGQRCSADGRCIDDPGMDGGTRDATTRDGPSGGGSDNVCARVEVGASTVVPTVILIIDQSTSMNQDFSDGRDRWNVLRDSLLDTMDGLIAELESRIRFGLALYSAENDGDDHTPADPPCPMMTTVDPSLDNLSDISSVYRDAEPIEDTPTGDAIDSVLDGYLATPDPGPDPVIFVLATDGEPDRCEQADPNPTDEAQREAVQAVERAFENGIRTFLIDVGNGVGPAHKRDIANAGIGTDSGAMFWNVTDDTGLRDALQTIIGGELSCEIQLEGRITDLSRACEGTVELNGRVLPCEDPNGWRALDDSTIELQGEACNELEESRRANVEASFPCDGVILI